MNNKILVVEDDPVNCSIYLFLLKEFAVELDFAHDGLVGWQKFNDHYYDLLILDIGLPIIDGITLTEKIRTQERETNLPAKPIIIVTADCSSENKERSKAAGANEYLVKPVNKLSLVEKINKYVPISVECLEKGKQ